MTRFKACTRPRESQVRAMAFSNSTDVAADMSQAIHKGIAYACAAR